MLFSYKLLQSKYEESLKNNNLEFFFIGAKPQKTTGLFWSNLNPQTEIAVVSALAPGIGVIENLDLLNSFTMKVPGSEIDGVPASLT